MAEPEAAALDVAPEPARDTLALGTPAEAAPQPVPAEVTTPPSQLSVFARALRNKAVSLWRAAPTPVEIKQTAQQDAAWAAAQAWDAVQARNPELFAQLSLEIVPPQRPVAPAAEVTTALAGLAPADAECYQAVVTQLTVAGRQALERQLLAGQLPGTSSSATGKSYLQGLAAVAAQPLAPGIDRGFLLSYLVRQTADPSEVRQGQFNTCGAGTAQIVLASTNPAEYVRIAAGLASPAGRVQTRGGDTLQRPNDWQVGLQPDGPNGRDLASTLFQPAFMQAMEPPGLHYVNRTGSDFQGDGARLPFGLVLPGASPVAQAHLIQSLTGDRRAACILLDGKIVVDGVKVPQAGLQVSAAGNATPWRTASVSRPVTVVVNYLDSAADKGQLEPHYLVVEGYDAATHSCTVINPWGRREKIAESMLRDHLLGMTFPA